MIHNLKSQNDFSGFYIVYNGSVLNETPKNYGISHMIEHLMCKQFEHLYDAFDRYGINWNAYTSNNNVVFHLTGLDEYVNNYKNRVLKNLLKFNLTKEQFDTEKDIILQEYMDHFQDQSDSHYSNVMRQYMGHYGPIGKYESLDKISYSSLLKFQKNYMSKPTMIINVSKYNDFEGYDDFNEQNHGNFNTLDTKIIYEKKAEFNKTSLIGYKLITDDYPQVKFILSMLAGSLKAPLYNEIREKRGLSYSVSAFLNSISANQGIMSTSIITDNNKINQAMDVYKDVFSNPDTYLTESRFNIVKDYFTILLRKNEINRYNRIGFLMSDKKWNIEPILKDLTFDNIKSTYEKHFKYDDIRWSIDKKDF